MRFDAGQPHVDGPALQLRDLVAQDARQRPQGGLVGRDGRGVGALGDESEAW